MNLLYPFIPVVTCQKHPLHKRAIVKQLKHKLHQPLITAHNESKREDNNLLGTNLIGQAVQRPSQTVHSSAKGQVGVRQGTAHQVAGVGTDVASFMVTVTSQKHIYKLEHFGIHLF